MVQQLIGLVDQGIALAGSGDRADLRRRLEQTRERLQDPNIRVIVVGEFKQGKSQLINALVNAPVCPVDDDIATAVPTTVRYGERARTTCTMTAPSTTAATAAVAIISRRFARLSIGEILEHARVHTDRPRTARVGARPSR